MTAVRIISFVFCISASSVSYGASTMTTTFFVNANISPRCSSISSSGLDFATGYAPLSGQSATATGSISVLCAKDTYYEISLDVGQGSGASYGDGRVMTNGVDTLKYNIYTDASYSTVWGDGTSGSTVLTGTGDGSFQDYVIYGKIPESQTNASRGAYSDLVTATVSY